MMTSFQLAQSLVVLMVVLGAIVAARPLILRWGNMRTGASASPFRIRGNLQLDRARRLMLIDCEGQSVLLVVGGHNDVIMPWPEKGASS
ncbi:hypothetical protein [Brytella acorum]|uniref:Flagellar biosynthetic protein FliO n=1 Tax=Brytella acorum TaxID=2959299 RepID=A0AA35UV34_9PROT|nr:hypothetical protein [Brytella acorum]MDF3624918.1 hypothetical protein [Brytella acorum]CAI9120224.1 hypothetical protein LMG32879_001054 [Brytella acorum]